MSTSQADFNHNLRAKPQATIEVGTDTIDVVATEATGDERNRLFTAQSERAPHSPRTLH
jgi:hypothetical protein